MIKRYCNKCDKEISNKDEYRRVNMKISGRAMLGADWNIDFCEDCFEEVIGKSVYEDFIRKENEHKKRVEERKKRSDKE